MRAAAALALLLTAAPAAAQEMSHGGMGEPSSHVAQSTGEVARPGEGETEGAAHALQNPAPSTASRSPAPVNGGGEQDYAADRDYDPAAMAHARQMAREEMGGMRFSKAMANIAEHQSGGGYRWDGQAWYGGDINRLVLRSEGEGRRGEGLETGEVQALYSRAIGRYFDLQGGVRQDFAPRARTYVAAGVQGLLPLWVELDAAVFVSTHGELLARTEASYDIRLAQRLVLQPRAELNFAAQDTPETRTGSGLTNAELGLRLRYEIRREFAPYVGVSWERRVGRTADHWRAAGEDPAGARFVVGLRAWY